MAQRQIPPTRTAIYYIGQALCGIGLVCFISTFFSAASSFGDFRNFEERGRSEATRAVIGIVMMIAGGVMLNIGRLGLAGSGVKLDPEKARSDVEPWSRMMGGVVKDALDEADIEVGNLSSEKQLPFDERLRRLQKLRDDNFISEKEYQSTKKKILKSA